MNDPAANIRAAFREVTLGLMSWEPLPLMSPREYRKLEGIRLIYKPYDKQGETEPYAVDIDQFQHDHGI